MRLRLPKDRDERVKAILQAVEASLPERNRKLVWWRVVDYFLQGVRTFTVFDYDTGAVEIAYIGDEETAYTDDFYGSVPFRVEEVTDRLAREHGRLMKLDLSPRVSKRSDSLDSLRHASVYQLILNYMHTLTEADQVDRDFLLHLCNYGTSGYGHWIEELPDTVFGYEHEMVPAWQLLGIPGETNNHSEERAICRRRLVPVAMLEANANRFKLPGSKDWAKLGVMELQYGQGSGYLNQLAAGTGAGGAGGRNSSISPAGQSGTIRDLYESATDESRAVKGKDANGIERFVMLNEVWTRGPRNTVLEYSAIAGEWELRHDDFSSKPLPHPLGIARYTDTGHFYGADFPRKVIPLAQRLERMLRKLADNVEDMDRFGFLFVPNDIGVTQEDLKNTTTPRFVFYEHDITTDRDPVFQVSPVNSSDVPGRVAQFFSETLDRSTSQGPLYQGSAPGRVDSGTGIAALDELGSTHLIPTAKSIEACKTTVYRSMLQQAKMLISEGAANGEQIDLVRIDNSMAGIRIDPASGTLKLEGLKLPSVWAVDLGIKSSDPNSREQERLEAIQMLDAGRVNLLNFTIENYRKGWNFDLGPSGRATWENYVKAVLMNLVLFNDGKEPGTLTRDGSEEGGVLESNDMFDKAEVHLLALEEFTATAAFGLASDAVRNEFFKRMQDLQARMGEAGLPPGAPNREEAALMEQAMMAGQQQQLPELEGAFAG